jgi:hypothetical protein
VLDVATAETTEAKTLQALELKHIPVSCNDRVRQLISAACMSASNIRLDHGCSNQQHVRQTLTLQLSEALSQNTGLTSLQLTTVSKLWRAYHRLFESLTGLQRLELASSKQDSDYDLDFLPFPRYVANLLSLTHLSLGPGFHLMELPDILPHMSHLRGIRLTGEFGESMELMALKTLTALRTLELHGRWHMEALPSLEALVALETLDLSGCELLQQIPPLDSLTALQTLKLGFLQKLQNLPCLRNLTALQTLQGDFMYVQEWPALDTLTNLQTLDLGGCQQVQQFPDLHNLTNLQSLRFSMHLRLQELPCLDTFENLQTLCVSYCNHLLELPPLDTLTALQTLKVSDCQQLAGLPSLQALSALTAFSLE